MEYMLWMGESVGCLDKVYSFEQIIKEVHKVSLEDVRAVARQIFQEGIINLALIGPRSKSEKQIYSKLNLG
jgi:predicted Zn-dependent peptidase